MRAAVVISCLVIGIVAPAEPLHAGGFRGAEEALRQLSRPPERPAPVETPISRFRRDLSAYREGLPSLAPNRAAEEWLKLADRLSTLGLTSPPDAAGQPAPDADQPLRFGELMAALPPPPAWGAIASGLEERGARPDAGIRGAAWSMLAHLLRGDVTAVWEDSDALERAYRQAKPEIRQAQEDSVLPLLAVVTQMSGDRERLVRAVDLRITNCAGLRELALPDLVPLAGKQHATELIRRALLNSRVAIRITGGNETHHLAQRLALDLVARLPAPQWDLARSMESTELYDVMLRRFPAQPAPAAKGGILVGRPNPDASARETARLWSTLALAAHGRTGPVETLAPVLRSLSQTEPNTISEAFRELERVAGAGRTEEVLRLILIRSPDLSLWDEYLDRAARTGHLAAALDTMEKVRARPGTTEPTRKLIDGQRFQYLLGAGKVEAAEAILQRLANPAIPAGAAPSFSDSISYGSLLARLGEIEKKPEWIKHGLESVRSASPQTPIYFQYSEEAIIADLLERLERAPEAEEVLINGLARCVRNDNFGFGFEAPQYQCALAGLYYRAGRYGDVLYLLKHAPRWPFADLSGIYQLHDGHGLSLGTMTAGALAALGEPAHASELLHRVLRSGPAEDAAFELLLRLDGEKALLFLDELIARDPLDRVPVLWKAVLLRKRNRLDAAEAAARAALPVDPAEPLTPGWTLRAAEVLAGILEARGKTGEAKPLREAAAAAALGDEGDRCATMNLVAEAVARYREAVARFPASTSLRLRLAVQLTKSGSPTAADEQVQQAIALLVAQPSLPAGGLEIDAALAPAFERVLSRRTDSSNPNVQFLLGVLRASQERNVEAARYFREVVKARPDATLAWWHLTELADNAALTADERDRAMLALLRGDPLQRHHRPATECAVSLRAVWQAQSHALELRSARMPADLYPLTESAAFLQQALREHPEWRTQRDWAVDVLRMRMGDRAGSDRELCEPAERVARQELVGMISDICDRDRASRHAN